VKPLSECQIAVVGLGLMGGSLAGALTQSGYRVSGVARRGETIREALERGLIVKGDTDPLVIVPAADIVILATPVRTIIDQIGDLGSVLRPGCLLMDLGSTKGQIVDAMQRLPESIQPLGGHPMCGSEEAGIVAADPDLYRGASFILTPLERTSAEAVEWGTALARSVGAFPIVLDAERQDRLVATLSHLPYLLACALVRTADETTSLDPAAWRIVAGGYRDTSRVAGSDVSMMIDILQTNREPVLDAVRALRAHLDRLTEMVDRSAEDELRAALSACRDERRRMFS